LPTREEPPIGVVPGRGSSLVLTRMNGHYAASLAELVGEAGQRLSRSGRLRTELILAVGVESGLLDAPMA
jgi:hypothetical protein